MARGSTASVSTRTAPCTPRGVTREASWRRALDPANLSPMAAFMAPVRGVADLLAGEADVPPPLAGLAPVDGDEDRAQDVVPGVQDAVLGDLRR